MRAVSLTSKLAILVGFLTTFMTAVAILVAFLFIFMSSEIEIKKDLNSKLPDVVNLAVPEKSTELATYLRGNDLSLLLVNDTGEVVARYGIYRNLSSREIQRFVSLEDGYLDITIPEYGYYDVLTAGDIQLASKNYLTPILKKTAVGVLIIFLPLVWIASGLIGVLAGNLIMNSYIKKQVRIIEHISHELKVPITHTILAIQSSADKKLLPMVRELVDLGRDIDSILSLSLLNKFSGSETGSSILKKELMYYADRIPNYLHAKVIVKGNKKLPIPAPYLRIIVKNLIENAIKHSEKNTKIEILGNVNTNSWQIEIKNTVTKTHRVYGFGLGLLIVQDIARRFKLKMHILKSKEAYVARLEGRM